MSCNVSDAEHSLYRTFNLKQDSAKDGLQPEGNADSNFEVTELVKDGIGYVVGCDLFANYCKESLYRADSELIL